MDDASLQALVDEVPQAHWSYSDALPAYQDRAFDFGLHFPMHDKSQTYSVEGANAELRHYLARRARKSHSIKAFRTALRLFVYCWNCRQLYKQSSHYPAHLIDLVNPAF